MITRRDLLTVAAAGVAFSAANIAKRATAQQLARTAHILSGFTPGLQDALARLVAGQMKDYAETIIVETRPGAGGRVAVEAAKTADADGSVMLLAPLGFMILFPHVYKTLRYQPQDFTPVSTIASTPTLLTVGSKVPGEVKTLTDFVAWCRANPKQATYGTPGAGTTLHFLGAMLGRTAGFDYLHIPYQGNGAIQDLLKGEIASAIMPVGSSLGLVQSGDIRALATTGPAPQPIRSRGTDGEGSRLSSARGPHMVWVLPSREDAGQRRRKAQYCHPGDATHRRGEVRHGKIGGRARRDRHGRLCPADRIRIRPVESDRTGNRLRPNRLEAGDRTDGSCFGFRNHRENTWANQNPSMISCSRIASRR